MSEILNGAKNKIKSTLVEKQHRRYEEALALGKQTYNSWIRNKESAVSVHGNIIPFPSELTPNSYILENNGSDENKNDGLDAKNVDFYQFSMNGGMREEDKLLLAVTNISNLTPELLKLLQRVNIDIIIFKDNNFVLSHIALPLMGEKFYRDNNCPFCYGDWDELDKLERVNPHLLPDWSPDAFLQDFYFRGVIALPVKRLQEFYKADKKNEFESGEKALYLCLKYTAEKSNMFTVRNENTSQVHIDEILAHDKIACATEESKYNRNIIKRTEYQGNEEVSIIIPSKDNPDILKRCLESLTRLTTYLHYEVIVIDNGSNPENRKKYETICNDSKRFNYYYKPMEFNFSRMCNIGAGKANGDYLLFLNDDMEIIQSDWLEKLMEKATRVYTGAVGAKLLYPDTNIIQHAGITNLRVGPAHKMQLLPDDKSYYYGRNRGDWNVLGVTGACLLVSKSIFNQVNGFPEELAVAFNDVALCYSIHEAGYYNVQRNDVVLFHHESLSRGKDGDDPAKQQRLLREKDILYQMHQRYYGKDPYYHKYLTNDMLESDYHPASRYEVTLQMPWCSVKILPQKLKEVRIDPVLRVGMECAFDIVKWKYGVDNIQQEETPGFFFQGYAFVIGADNACYERSLLLKNMESDEVYALNIETRYRQDIAENLKDQLNVDLTGFACKLKKEDIPEGKYQFGMLAVDNCSRTRIINWSSWQLENH